MAMSAEALLASAKAPAGNAAGLGKSAEIDALVKELRLGNREARKQMKLMLTAGKITANTLDDSGCPLLLSVCQVCSL